MKPESLSAEKQLENCLVAVGLWKKVSPRRVDLDAWTCGTQACFGGHLARWPEFQAQGIRTGYDGEPYVGDQGGTYSEDWIYADRHLFGDNSMFACRGRHVVDDDYWWISDHAIVLRRLEYRINELVEEVAA